MSSFKKNFNISDFGFGCVFFDDQDDPVEGWATISSQNPVRIFSAGDLSNDVIWLTNLDYKSFNLAGLSGRLNMKRSSFFRSDLSTLSREIGLDCEDNFKLSFFFSEIFERVMRISFSHYKFKKIEETLSDTIRGSLLPKDKNTGNLVVDYAIEQATQSLQRCEGRIPKGSSFVSFRFPRVDYAREILSYPVPNGGWKILSKDIGVDEISEKYIETPLLCKIKITDIDPSYAGIISFANGSGAPRVWATGQEIAFLSKFSSVRIQKCFFAEEYTSPTRLAKRDIMDFGKAGHFSLSSGILAENHWVAMSSKCRLFYGDVYSARACWMRSWDRILCLFAVKEFVDAGFHVSMYGTGSLVAAVTSTDAKAAVAIASKFKMVAGISFLRNIYDSEAEKIK